MSEKGRGLLAAAGMLPKRSDSDDGEDEDKEPGDSDDPKEEVSEGETSAMADWAKAHSDGDHEGMARAMGRFLDCRGAK